jgi:hypothetical protein
VCARSAQRRNSVVSSEKTRITEDFEEFCKKASSKCIGAQGPRTVERSMEKRLRQEGIERVCKAQENRELFEFCHVKEESKEGSSLDR